MINQLAFRVNLPKLDIFREKKQILIIRNHCTILRGYVGEVTFFKIEEFSVAPGKPRGNLYVSA